MQETLVAVRVVERGAGKGDRFSYYRMKDSHGYGVCVKNQKDAVAIASGVTEKRGRIDALLNWLIQGLVSPIQMQDVVDDWLVC